jgi:hypothetical protein
MFRLFSRTFWFMCFATVTVASAFRASEGNNLSLVASSSSVMVRHRPDDQGGRSDTAQMVLLGLGLNYVGRRIGKRKA